MMEIRKETSIEEWNESCMKIEVVRREEKKVLWKTRKIVL